MRAFSAASRAAVDVATTRSRSLTIAAKRLMAASLSSPRAILSMSASRSCTTAGSSTVCVARAAPDAAITAMRTASLRISGDRHFVAELHRSIHLGIGLLELAQIAPRRRPIAEHDVGLDQHRQRRLVDATDGEAGAIEPLRLAILV